MERKILIVDDEEQTEISIEAYEGIFEFLKEKLQLNYSIKFYWKKSLQEAKELLKKNDLIFDALLIDYDFPKEIHQKKGVDLVKEIRESINKRCKIVFYTMHAPHELSPKEFIDLINNDVFKFVSKDGSFSDLIHDNAGYNRSDQLIVEALIESLTDLNPVSLALERILHDFKHSTDDIKININGDLFSIHQVLDSIRLYEEPGNMFIDNLLDVSMMDFLELD